MNPHRFLASLAACSACCVPVFAGQDACEIPADSQVISLQRPWFTVAGDFNEDGLLDCVSGKAEPEWLRNNGDGTFTAFSLSNLEQPLSAEYEEAIAADFRGNGHLGLALVIGSQSLMIAHGTGNGTFHDPNYYSVGFQPRDLASADFNGDGHLDVAVSCYGGDKVSVVLNQGTGSFGATMNTYRIDKPQKKKNP